MNIDINDLEERYARMSEKELASIRPQDLTEVARQCYERAASRRQAAPAPATRDDPPSETSLEGIGAERGEGTALRSSRVVANVLSVFSAFCTVLLMKDGFGLVQLFGAVLTNILLYYLFRVPYYIIKGYSGR